MSTSATPTALRIRRAAPEDAEAAGRICYDAFAGICRAHGFPPDFPSPQTSIDLLAMLFAHPGLYCLVAESHGRIVGSNCLDERAPIAGLGPITVEPSLQNASIGRQLMTAMLDRARERGHAGVRLLQSAFHNRSLSLYAKLGFDAREPMSVMQGPAIGQRIDMCAVRRARPSDVATCNRLCEQVHGLARARELDDGVARGTAVVVERHGRITGYASDVGFFGHAVAESDLDLQAVIANAESFSGPGIIVPTRNAGLFRWCLNHGLRVMQPLTLMSTGLYQEPRGAYLPSILY